MTMDIIGAGDLNMMTPRYRISRQNSIKRMDLTTDVAAVVEIGTKRNLQYNWQGIYVKNSQRS